MKVRRGVTRTVVLAGRYAVKVPSLRPSSAGWTRHPHALRGRLWAFTAGVRANLSEAEWSPLLGDAVAPVLASWFGGIVNVYPRAVPAVELRASDEVWLAVTPDERPDLMAGLMIDPKPENLGYIDGHLVWVDYDQSQGVCEACRRYTHEHAHV